MKTWQDKNSPLYNGLPFMKIRGQFIPFPCAIEVKYDGEFQYLVSKDGNNHLLNKQEHGRIRTDMPCTNVKLPDDSVFIGELIYGSGIDFYDFLRHKLSEDNMRLAVFDVLRYNGRDVTQLVYTQRRKILEQQTFYNKHILLVDKFEALDKKQLDHIYFHVCLMGFEGIVIKDPLSRYVDGDTGRWVKKKQEHDADLVIIGFQTGTKRAKTLSLYLGHKALDGSIQPITHCGGGIKQKEKEQILKVLQQNVIGKAKDDYLVPPKIVVTVKHNGVIYDGSGNPSSLRHPNFKCIRQDKVVKDIDTIK